MTQSSIKVQLASKKKQLGAAIIEYALIAALIAVGAITVLGQVGGGVNTSLGKAVTALNK